MRQEVRTFIQVFSILVALTGFSSAWAAKDFVGVTLSQTSYAGDPQISEQDKQYSAATPYINYENIWGRRESSHTIFKAEALFVLPMSDSVDWGVAVPELYVRGVSPNATHSVAVGRKKEVWSELDSKWNLGLWQPLVRWDSALPFEQGLSGLFYQYKLQNKFRLVLMGSPLFLPDQQPGYEEKDGRIVSSNRWFRAPVSQIAMQQTTSKVFYEVIEPQVEDVILQPSGAAMVYLGDDEYGFFTKVSYSSKVANQYHLGIDVKDILSIVSIDFTAPIYPVTVRHQLLTTELGYGWNYTRLTFSRNIEKYQNPKLPKQWEETELMDATYDGVIIAQNLLPFGFKKSTLGLSYVKRTIADNPKESTLIEGDVEASTQRFLFDELVGIDLRTNLKRTFREELDVNFKYVHSISDKGEWVQAGMHYKYYQKWIWGLSGDMFGVPADTSSSTSFISKFRGNDRIMGSLTYVF